MESNFIRERVVVREQLIKKNLHNEKKASSSKQHQYNTKDILKAPASCVQAVEEVINDKLRQDLVAISEQVDRTCTTIADYIKVKAALKLFKTNSKNVRVQSNLGCNFYAQCHIDDASKVYLCVGQNYFLHMDLDEALKMIDFKEKQLMKELDNLQLKASKIKAYIKVALEVLDRVG